MTARSATSSAAPALGWAVVGTGQVSRLLGADLALLPGAVRSAVLSRSIAAASALCDELGFTSAYDDIDRMLADPAVDIVYIATPHATHGRLAIRALESGKHVLIEKPIAATAAEAARISVAASRSGRFAMEAMWMKFSPTYRAMLDSVRAGAIGDVRSVRASFGLPFGEADDARWSAERASSTLLDQGVYPVTLALDVLGEPETITADGRVRADGVDLAEHMTFGYADGRFAQLGASMVEYLEPTASISGTTGWLTMDAPFWASNGYTMWSGSIPDALGRPPARVQRATQGYGFVPMLEAVSQAIAAGLTEHADHPMSRSLLVMRLLDRIRSHDLISTTTEDLDSALMMTYKETP